MSEEQSDPSELAAPDEADRSEPDLAAVVDKRGGEVAIAALREEGVFDPDRRVVEHDDGTLAVPVTEPPETDVLRVVRDWDPERRTRDLADHLRERGWSDEQVETAPSSWAVVGTVVLVEVPDDCHDEGAVGEALLELHREADTVLAREGVDGQTRDPERRVLAGIGDTETVHTEHGVRYALDLAEIMFSPGNKAERARLGALVGASDVGSAGGGPGAPAASIPSADVPDRIADLDPVTEDDRSGVDSSVDALDAVGGPRERVFDMFAGAGYFTLPAAIAGARVTAAEIDPDTFGYLIENAQLNGVGDRVSAYVADCREVAEVVEADRVVMGHYDAHEYLDAAFEAIREDGVLHYHEVTPEPELPDRPQERLASAAERAGRSVEVIDVRRVKSYGEGVWHVVADARVA